MLGGSIPLPAVLEPVADLRRGQARGLGQLLLLARRRIRIRDVPLLQHFPRLLLEAVRRLLAVPDRPGQGEFTPHPVLACEKTESVLWWKTFWCRNL